MSALTRAGSALAALLAALVLAAGCGSGSPAGSVGPPGSTLTHTKIVEIAPVTSTGTVSAGYRTTAVASEASCISGSEAIGRAFRCFAGNEVYDPCWPVRTSTVRTAAVRTAAVRTSTVRATTATAAAVCLVAPWSRNLARLTVSGQFGPVPAVGGVTEPWGVQLRDGTRCVLVQGAHAPFRGVPVDYYCGPDLGLLHGLTEGSGIWSAHGVRIGTSGHMSAGPDEKIAIAWFGRPARYR
jgi:hypothetical protein